MATANRISPTGALVIRYGRYSEEMDSLRARADSHVKKAGRPVRDQYDEDNNSHYIVLESRGTMIGCIRLTPERSDVSGPAIQWLDKEAQQRVSMIKGKPSLMHISRTVVHPKHQGKGLGALLFLRAFEFIQKSGYQEVIVLVEPNIRQTKRRGSFRDFLIRITQPTYQDCARAMDTPGKGVPVDLIYGLVDAGETQRQDALRTVLQKVNDNFGRTFLELQTYAFPFPSLPFINNQMMTN